jgi:hypothetical protein
VEQVLGEKRRQEEMQEAGGSEQKILKVVNDMEGVVFASNRLDEAGCRDTSAVPNENQRL